MSECRGARLGPPAAASGGNMAQDLHEVGVRVEELLAELRSEADPTVHRRAEALVSLLVEFYGAGLERALDLVGREPSGDLINRRLAQDDLLGSLFSLHGIHPVPVDDRVARGPGQGPARHWAEPRSPWSASTTTAWPTARCPAEAVGARRSTSPRRRSRRPSSTPPPRFPPSSSAPPRPRLSSPGRSSVEIGRTRVKVEIGRKPGAGGSL